MARKDRKPDGRRFNDGERQGAQKSGRERTQFKKGHPGYRNGAPNKTTRIMKEAMIFAAEQVGDLSGINPKNLSKEGIEHGTDGLVGYLRWPPSVSRNRFSVCWAGCCRCKPRSIPPPRRFITRLKNSSTKSADAA
jgi:hypothetical protein